MIGCTGECWEPRVFTIAGSRLPLHGILQFHSWLNCVPPIGQWWCTWTTLPSRLHYWTTPLAANPGPRWGCISLRETMGALASFLQPLKMGYMLVWFIWRPMRMLLCPHSHLWAPQVICSDIKGPHPWSPCLELVDLKFSIVQGSKMQSYEEICSKFKVISQHKFITVNPTSASYIVNDASMIVSLCSNT